jgi:hypothetical protein
MRNVHSPSLDPIEAGAPEQEIEITPEMIEAGVQVLRRFFYDEPNDDITREVAKEIFVAMFFAYRQQNALDCI